VAVEIDRVGDLAEQAFRAHYGQILRFVRRQSESEEDAEDIAQSVFVDATASLDSFKPGATPVLAWLYTVAQRRLIDEARRRSRRLRVVDLDAPFTVSGDSPAYGTEVTAVLRDAIASLPSRQREVVLARLVEDAAFATIAEATGTTEAACKMRFARGIAHVRDQLRKEGINR
jgi:RNA polymerase sigma factor (sigma-70 family)